MARANLQRVRNAMLYRQNFRRVRLFTGFDHLLQVFDQGPGCFRRLFVGGSSTFDSGLRKQKDVLWLAAEVEQLAIDLSRARTAFVTPDLQVVHGGRGDHSLELGV